MQRYIRVRVRHRVRTHRVMPQRSSKLSRFEQQLVSSEICFSNTNEAF
jgi:hypothetical protein